MMKASLQPPSISVLEVKGNKRVFFINLSPNKRTVMAPFVTFGCINPLGILHEIGIIFPLLLYVIFSI